MTHRFFPSLKFTQPLDPIMYANSLFNKSRNSDKLNLVIGAYRLGGHPYIFRSVQIAKTMILSQPSEYLPIKGDEEFLKVSSDLYWSSDTNMKSFQTLSGTGSLYLLSSLLGEINPGSRLYLPIPTWDNHHNIFKKSHEIFGYGYLTSNRKWNFEFLMDQIKKIPNDSTILFHGCSHNPSGYDPNFIEWTDIIKLCTEKNLLIVVDMAYLGFGSGNLFEDSKLLRIIDKQDYPVFVSSSYAKNFGLYSERVGNLFYRSHNKEEDEQIQHKLIQIVRSNYSNPPSNGSKIIKTIFSNSSLKSLWESELISINSHYKKIRSTLKEKLENVTGKDFSEIVDQQGMFYYPSNFSDSMYRELISNEIFIPDNGRISLAGLNDENIDKFVQKYSGALNII
jgi:aspartate/tyrosine/aromatic aminotransferase